ncbi:MAG: protein kinase domain-containing protein [Frankiaceae bacterium]
MQGWGPPGTGLLPDEARRTGPWQLLRRLGSGGMGVVYLGVRGPAELAAVKLIRPEYVANSLLRARFRREVEAARQVRGRHVARVLDADPDAPMPYLATEYIPGESLAEGIRQRGPMPEAHCRMLAAGLTEALAEIHAAGVVHRDVKPQNVLLAPEGPKLIDFGIVSVADSVTLTDTGKMIGTLGFMAPEQLYGHVATPATDVFGWGVTIAYAARGSSPFGPGPDLVRVDRIRAGERDLEGVPASLAGLVWAALEPDPAARPSIADLRAAMTGVHDPGLGSQAPESATDPGLTRSDTAVLWSAPPAEPTWTMPEPLRTIDLPPGWRQRAARRLRRALPLPLAAAAAAPALAAPQLTCLIALVLGACFAVGVGSDRWHNRVRRTRRGATDVLLAPARAVRLLASGAVALVAAVGRATPRLVLAASAGVAVAAVIAAWRVVDRRPAALPWLTLLSLPADWQARFSPLAGRLGAACACGWLAYRWLSRLRDAEPSTHRLLRTRLAPLWEGRPRTLALVYPICALTVVLALASPNAPWFPFTSRLDATNALWFMVDPDGARSDLFNQVMSLEHDSTALTQAAAPAIVKIDSCKLLAPSRDVLDAIADRHARLASEAGNLPLQRLAGGEALRVAMAADETALSAAAAGWRDLADEDLRSGCGTRAAVARRTTADKLTAAATGSHAQLVAGPLRAVRLGYAPQPE